MKKYIETVQHYARQMAAAYPTDIQNLDLETGLDKMEDIEVAHILSFIYDRGYREVEHDIIVYALIYGGFR